MPIPIRFFPDYRRLNRNEIYHLTHFGFKKTYICASNFILLYHNNIILIKTVLFGFKFYQIFVKTIFSYQGAGKHPQPRWDVFLQPEGPWAAPGRAVQEPTSTPGRTRFWTHQKCICRRLLYSDFKKWPFWPPNFGMFILSLGHKKVLQCQFYGLFIKYIKGPRTERKPSWACVLDCFKLFRDLL